MGKMMRGWNAAIRMKGSGTGERESKRYTIQSNALGYGLHPRTCNLDRRGSPDRSHMTCLGYLHYSRVGAGTMISDKCKVRDPSSREDRGRSSLPVIRNEPRRPRAPRICSTNGEGRARPKLRPAACSPCSAREPCPPTAGMGEWGMGDGRERKKFSRTERQNCSTRRTDRPVAEPADPADPTRAPPIPSPPLPSGRS